MNSFLYSIKVTLLIYPYVPPAGITQSHRIDLFLRAPTPTTPYLRSGILRSGEFVTFISERISRRHGIKKSGLTKNKSKPGGGDARESQNPTPPLVHATSLVGSLLGMTSRAQSPLVVRGSSSPLFCFSLFYSPRCRVAFSREKASKRG